jgi:hypothetical protein
MAGRTQAEKLDDLTRLTAILEARLESLKDTINEMKGEQAGFRAELATLTTRIALLEHQTADLRKGKEEWGRRLWMVLGPILGAIVGGVIGYFLRR